MSEHALEMMKSEKLHQPRARCSTCGTSRGRRKTSRRARRRCRTSNEIARNRKRASRLPTKARSATKEDAEMADAAERAAQGLGGAAQSEGAAVRNSAQGRGSNRAQADAAQDRASWPRKSIAPPKTVTTSAASSGRAAGSPPARVLNWGGAWRATRNSASWRGWSGGSSRTRAH